VLSIHGSNGSQATSAWCTNGGGSTREAHDFPCLNATNRIRQSIDAATIWTSQFRLR
jgi:hypothetical protein